MTEPALYTIDDTGRGPFSGQVVYVQTDATQTVAQSEIDDAGSASPTPIDIGDAKAQVYPVLYGTGLRHGSSVAATVNGIGVPVTFLGAQAKNPGLDRINLGPCP